MLIDVEQVLAQARHGSVDALGALLSSFHPYLMSVAVKKWSFRSNARFQPSDVVQATFVRAYEGFAGFEGRTNESLRGWLRRILLNTLSDFDRSHRQAACRAAAREVSYGEFTNGVAIHAASKIADPNPTPHTSSVLAEDWSRFMRQIWTLSEADRLVLVLYHFEHQQFREIGQKLGVSEAAAMKRYQRAKQRLCAAMSKSTEKHT